MEMESVTDVHTSRRLQGTTKVWSYRWGSLFSDTRHFFHRQIHKIHVPSRAKDLLNKLKGDRDFSNKDLRFNSFDNSRCEIGLRTQGRARSTDRISRGNRLVRPYQSLSTAINTSNIGRTGILPQNRSRPHVNKIAHKVSEQSCSNRHPRNCGRNGEPAVQVNGIKIV